MPIKTGTRLECRLPVHIWAVSCVYLCGEVRDRGLRDQNICSNWVQWGGQTDRPETSHFTRHNHQSGLLVALSPGPAWPGGGSQVISMISLEKLLTAGCLLFFQVELVWRIICFGHHQPPPARPEQENTKTFNIILSVIQTVRHSTFYFDNI